MTASAAAHPVLSVERLVKSYPTLTAVRELSFSIPPGEITAMVGPNGAGKTTTMRCIAGVFPPSSGSIRVAGHDIVTDSVRAKQRLAYVPDDPKLFESLTVDEHLEFIAAAYKLTNWKDRAAQLLDLFELTPKRSTAAAELSRGMRQKTAIVCAYLHEPTLVMLDEPLTGLDPRGIRTIKDSMRRLARAGGALLISSHLLALVEDLCTSLLIIHQGRLVFHGPMSEARAAFAAPSGDPNADPSVAADASLEEIFFRATEGADQTRGAGVPPASAPSPGSAEEGSVRASSSKSSTSSVSLPDTRPPNPDSPSH